MFNPKTMQEMGEDATFMDRLRQEYDELADKLTKLNDFMATSKFNTIDEIQKILLRKQRNLMLNYLNILELRLLNLGGTPFSLSQIEYVEKFCGGYGSVD